MFAKTKKKLTPTIKQRAEQFSNNNCKQNKTKKCVENICKMSIYFDEWCKTTQKGKNTVMFCKFETM